MKNLIIQVTVVHGGQIRNNGFRYLFQNYDPIEFLDPKNSLKFIIPTARKIRVVPFVDVESVSQRDGKFYIHYRKRDKNSRVTTVRIGPVSDSFNDFVYKPLRDYKELCNTVLRCFRYLEKFLRDEKSGLYLHFENFRVNNSEKIKSVGSQRFGDAAAYRDKEKVAMDAIFEHMQIFGGPDLEKAVEYVLKNYDQLLETFPPVEGKGK